MASTAETLDQSAPKESPWWTRLTYRSLHVFGILGVALIGAGFLIWRSQPDPSQPLAGLTLVMVTAFELVGSFFLLADVFGRAYMAALTWLTPILPALAAIGTVAAYLSGLAPNGEGAVLYGFIGMTMAWFALGAVGLDRTKAKGAQERAFAELAVRIDQLTGRLQTLPTDVVSTPGFAETVAALNSASRDLFGGEPGPQWASAIGYVNLWRTVHRTEEALIDVDVVPAVVASALVDDLRLAGSSIPGRDRLVEFLHGAVAELDWNAANLYLKPPPAAPPALPPGMADLQNIRARAMLREVRRAINDFRDARMEDIVRTRNILRRTFAFTAVVSYTLLVVAVLTNTPRDLIGSATALFLVAALVGLFSRLRNTKVAQSTVDDFGLYESQLLAGPLVSGIAGIGGVVIIAAAPVAAAALSAVNPTPGAAVPTLDFLNIFDLARNPLAVVFAAIFGLTPDLLLSRLQDETERLKKDLRSSFVADKSAAAPKSDDES